jgi:hypothetical protein
MLSTNGQLERLSWKSIYLRAVHARGLRATLPERPAADRPQWQCLFLRISNLAQAMEEMRRNAPI